LSNPIEIANLIVSAIAAVAACWSVYQYKQSQKRNIEVTALFEKPLEYQDSIFTCSLIVRGQNTGQRLITIIDSTIKCPPRIIIECSIDRAWLEEGEGVDHLYTLKIPLGNFEVTDIYMIDSTGAQWHMNPRGLKRVRGYIESQMQPYIDKKNYPLL